MKLTPRNGLLLMVGCGFVLLLLLAFWRETVREKTRIAQSISGLVKIRPTLQQQGLADVRKTDRLALFLVPVNQSRPSALAIVSPILPPQAISVGQDHAFSKKALKGPHWLIGIIDKDGELFRPTAGEVYGRSAKPILPGSIGVELWLDAPFRGGLFNGTNASANGTSGINVRTSNSSAEDLAWSIGGTLQVADELKKHLSPQDRLIILLFLPDLSRPVAVQIVPKAAFPQRFLISVPPAQRKNKNTQYYLRVVTDKDQSPFNAVPGELVGRSTQPISLGTTNLKFVLNSLYQR